MNSKAIAYFLIAQEIPSYRLKQIIKAVYQDGFSDFNEITALPEDLRKLLNEKFSILSFETEEVILSKDRKTYKARVRLKDKIMIETVLISSIPGSWTVCVSCQTGCVLGCAFCATGKIKKMRNLSAEEITDQIIFWKQHLRKLSRNDKLTNIVYMGMGEPFLNWKEVSTSIKDLINPESFGFRTRAISVSTAGIPEGITALAGRFPQVNLAISLHSADQKIRENLMPIAKRYSLEKISQTLRQYFRICHRKVFLEYMPLEKINDSEKDALKLANWINSIGSRHLLHVNLIGYNQTESEFLPSSQARTRKFKNYLLRQGIAVTVRKSLGQDIQGACGQLSQKQKT